MPATAPHGATTAQDRPVSPGYSFGKLLERLVSPDYNFSKLLTGLVPLDHSFCKLLKHLTPPDYGFCKAGCLQTVDFITVSWWV